MLTHSHALTGLSLTDSHARHNRTEVLPHYATITLIHSHNPNVTVLQNHTDSHCTHAQNTFKHYLANCFLATVSCY